MAMASNPNRNSREADGSQSSRNSTRRADPAQGHLNVPVLFRLKNLQRSESTGVASDPTATIPSTSSDTSSGRSAAPAQSGPSPKASNVHRENAASSGPPAPNLNAAPSSKPSANAIEAKGKHGVSNGFILLAVAVMIAFAIGRGSIKSHHVDTNSSALNGLAASAPTPIAPEASPTQANLLDVASVTPLVPPALPVVATDEATSTGHQDDDTKNSNANESIAKDTEVEGPTLDAPSQLDTAVEKSVVDDQTLPVPSMLVASEKESPQDVTLNSKSESPSQQHLSIGESTSNGAVVPLATAIVGEAPPESHSKLVATTAPEMDTAQLYEIRANYQSQMEAMAKARQSQFQQAMTTPVAQPTMQYAATQSTLAGQAVSATQYAPAPQIAPANQYVPTSPQAPAVSYTPPSQYAPIGRQLAYPSAVQPSQQSPAQAYQPLFNSPTMNSPQGYGQPTMPQAATAPYQNSAPSFQPN